MPAIQRAGHIRAVAAKLREHKTRLARRIAMDQGKILPLAEVEIDFIASYVDYLDYMAKQARRGTRPNHLHGAAMGRALTRALAGLDPQSSLHLLADCGHRFSGARLRVDRKSVV